jgi:hypothetical protein
MLKHNYFILCDSEVNNNLIKITFVEYMEWLLNNETARAAPDFDFWSLK